MDAKEAKTLTQKAKNKLAQTEQQRQLDADKRANTARLKARVAANEMFAITFADEVKQKAKRGENSITYDAENYNVLMLQEFANLCRNEGYFVDWHTSKDLDMDGGRYGEETTYLTISW